MVELPPRSFARALRGIVSLWNNLVESWEHGHAALNATFPCIETEVMIVR